MIRHKIDVQQRIIKSNSFGVDVQVNRSPLPKVNLLPNGDEHGTTSLAPLFTGYREVIPAGPIGTSDNEIDPQIPANQYVDTVPSYPTEQNDVRLHGPMAALRSADTQSIPFKTYDNFQPRREPMPRAAQDDVCLPYKANEHAADPLMKDGDSSQMFLERDAYKKDLYGRTRDGFLHNPIGVPPQNPATPTTNQATTRSGTFQVGRGMTRTPHGKRPPEVADQPMSLKRAKS
jgi:hypothetical protein